MKKTSEPIVFFGSGPVAAKSLEALNENFTIKAVITKKTPDHHHYEAPVVRVAQENSLKLYFVRYKSDLEDIILKDRVTDNIRLGVLVDFGIIIPKPVIDHFALGIVNSHFSLLPQWRGADPITFSVLSGQDVTGVSLMLISEGMDEGPLLSQQTYQLKADMTAPKLTDELIQLSNRMLTSCLPRYIAGELSPFTQDISEQPTYSRKLTKQDGEIDWRKSAKKLECEIRAFTEWPKSHALVGGVHVVIVSAHTTAVSGLPGTIDTTNKQLIVHCGEQSLIIDRLKPVGKNEMNAADFVRGYLGN